MTLALSQTIHAYNMRSEKSLFSSNPIANGKLNLVTLISFALIAFVAFTPGVVTAFGMTYMPAWCYGVAVGFGFAPIVLVEIYKLCHMLYLKGREKKASAEK